MSATLEQLRRVAEDVCEFRPDWSSGTVLNVLLVVRDRGGEEEIRDAALRAAKDPTSRTPSSIEFASNWQARRTTSGPFLAEPLPECTACGQPAAREVSERLAICPACREPWVPMVFRDDREEARRRAVPPNAEFRAAVLALRTTAPRSAGGEPVALGDILAPARAALPVERLEVPPF